MLSLRTDRFTYTKGETVSVEAYICNDTQEGGDYSVVFELYDGEGRLVRTANAQASSRECCVDYVANVEFAAFSERTEKIFC